MKQFMGDDFLLESTTAVDIYSHIRDLPIIDYHCHLDPVVIADNSDPKCITELWLGGDHYKWRLMRHYGIPEAYITGNAPDREKFSAFCEVLEQCVGSPIYTWAHMELAQFFGYTQPVFSASSGVVFDYCNEKISSGGFDPISLMRKARVEWLATTDDPADTLENHTKLAKIPDTPIVTPTFRPSRVLDIENEGFLGYLRRLGAAAGHDIANWQDLLDALESRLDYFDKVGCKLSDHALDPPVFDDMACDMCSSKALDKAFSRKPLDKKDIMAYKTRLLDWLGGQYYERGWIMQLHMTAQRGVNTKMTGQLGPDTGFDTLSDASISQALAKILNSMEARGCLPRTVLYSLNPAHDDMLSAMSGCFAGDGKRGKIQWGAPWWFNDHLAGIKKHFTTYANHGVFGTFIGMLTDSRSFLSYSRHDFFRRILASWLGCRIESGEYPANMELVKKIAANVSYNNVRDYLDLT